MYPDHVDQQSLGMGQASVMHQLLQEEGQLACSIPTLADHMEHGPASTAPLAPAHSLQQLCLGEDILTGTNQALRPQLLGLFTTGLPVSHTQQRISGWMKDLCFY